MSVNGVFKPDVNPLALEQPLNALGDDGWELVSALSVATGNGATIEIALMLKRPIAETEGIAGEPPPLPQLNR